MKPCETSSFLIAGNNECDVEESVADQSKRLDPNEVIYLSAKASFGAKMASWLSLYNVDTYTSEGPGQSRLTELVI